MSGVGATARTVSFRASSLRMFRRKPGPDLIRAGHRFAGRNMRRSIRPAARDLATVRVTRALTRSQPQALEDASPRLGYGERGGRSTIHAGFIVAKGGPA